MITQKNLKTLLDTMGFVKNGNVYEKQFPVGYNQTDGVMQYVI